MDTKSKTSGVIAPSELYTLEEFKKRMGLTDTAMRALRRKGFAVIRVGKRAFVLGIMAINFFVEEGLEDESESSQSSFEIFGPSLGMSSDGKEQAKVSQNKRQA
jgi:hypothetical protein